MHLDNGLKGLPEDLLCVGGIFTDNRCFASFHHSLFLRGMTTVKAIDC